jgi:polysaccharide biosynthesis/export protein
MAFALAFSSNPRKLRVTRMLFADLHRNLLAILLPLSLLAASGLADAQVVAPGEYRLHAGDTLDVSVWKELEMQRPAVVIAPDGNFSFPLAGQITAAGKTVAEVRQQIEAKLAKYIPDAVVTVGIAAVAGNVAYVVGQVTKPGALIMNPKINVLQALSLAGGGTPYAKMDSIIVIRGAQTAQQRVLPFRFGQVAAGKDLDQNVMLESGDVVLVP